MVDLEIFDRVWNGEFFFRYDRDRIDRIIIYIIVGIFCCIVNYDGLSFS